MEFATVRDSSELMLHSLWRKLWCEFIAFHQLEIYFQGSNNCSSQKISTSDPRQLRTCGLGKRNLTRLLRGNKRPRSLCTTMTQRPASRQALVPQRLSGNDGWKATDSNAQDLTLQNETLTAIAGVSDKKCLTSLPSIWPRVCFKFSERLERWIPRKNQ